ncbi:hypothetical protein FA15DRAFT_657040 [Coprinopsis marcescibilis]|uniref:Uncharacterized protein n=1 Tax=Coprinopsis marcescibilis TaxID=230819 RepID=A0A5C3KRB3_COPMA|nr:hypothetical protein FA15DRAFT_657040 [Coprinopsis marcescibilis]
MPYPETAPAKLIFDRISGEVILFSVPDLHKSFIVRGLQAQWTCVSDTFEGTLHYTHSNDLVSLQVGAISVAEDKAVVRFTDGLDLAGSPTEMLNIRLTADRTVDRNGEGYCFTPNAEDNRGSWFLPRFGVVQEWRWWWY